MTLQPVLSEFDEALGLPPSSLDKVLEMFESVPLSQCQAALMQRHCQDKLPGCLAMPLLTPFFFPAEPQSCWMSCTLK